MSLPPRILAKVDSRLRTELRKRDKGLTARVPMSKEQWAVWKRYCDMIGVSVGGGVAVLVDHELGSIVDEEVETLTDSVKAREGTMKPERKSLPIARRPWPIGSGSVNSRNASSNPSDVDSMRENRSWTQDWGPSKSSLQHPSHAHRSEPNPDPDATNSAGVIRVRSTRTVTSTGIRAILVS